MASTIVRRQRIDPASLQPRLDTTLAFLPKLVASIPERPVNLGLLISNALDAAAGTSVLAPGSPEVGRSLRLAMQAHAALFAIANAGAAPVEVELGDGPPLRCRGPMDESLVHGQRWVRGFFLALLCRDAEALDRLCETPTSHLRGSSTRCPEYVYLFVDGLRAFWQRDPGTIQVLLQALAATDPEREDIHAPDWVLHLDVPLIELTFYLHARDPDFAAALPRALELHKKYWTKGQKQRDWHGFLAFPLLGAAACADMREMEFDVESEYLPMELVRGEVEGLIG